MSRKTQTQNGDYVHGNVGFFWYFRVEHPSKFCEKFGTCCSFHSAASCFNCWIENKHCRNFCLNKKKCLNIIFLTCYFTVCSKRGGWADSGNLELQKQIHVQDI